MLTNKIQVKIMMIKYNRLKNENNFQVIKYIIQNTKNSHDMILKILAIIVIKLNDLNEDFTISIVLLKYQIYAFLYNLADFKIAISQQKDTLANTRDDSYNKKSKELQIYLQYNNHSDKFYFKLSNIRSISYSFMYLL